VIPSGPPVPSSSLPSSPRPALVGESHGQPGDVRQRTPFTFRDASRLGIAWHSRTKTPPRLIWTKRDGTKTPPRLIWTKRDVDGAEYSACLGTKTPPRLIWTKRDV